MAQKEGESRHRGNRQIVPENGGIGGGASGVSGGKVNFKGYGAALLDSRGVSLYTI